MWIASEDVSILILELNINDRIKPKFNYKCLLRASRQELKNPLGQAIKQVEAQMCLPQSYCRNVPPSYSI